MIDEVRGDLPALRDVVYIGEASWTSLLADGDIVDRDAVAVRAACRFDDPINIQYTSGTTGFPKGATLSHHNILNNGYFVGEICGYTEQDRICVPVPFYHCFGMVMGNLASTSHGACVVIPAPGFDPAATLQAVQEERCTSPVRRADDVHRRAGAADFADFDLGAADGDHGRRPLPGRGHEACHQRHAHGRGHHLLRHDRDVAGVDADPRDDPLDRRVSTVGRVHPHVEVKVVDPATGLVVPVGEPGELCTRGYSVMLGYWDEPEQTAEAIHRRAGCTPATWRRWTPRAI